MRIVQQFGNAFRIKEVRDRILFTLAMLIVFRLGVHIPLPGIDPRKIQDFMRQLQEQAGPLASWVSVFSGGALSRMGIFTLGIMPYITASIIMSLLTKVHPKLEALSKEGPAGQRKISQYTRLLTLPICIIQAIMSMQMLRGRGIAEAVFLYDNFLGNLTMMAVLCAGALFVMWLGEQISEFGLGNGASILITVGILDNFPSIVGTFAREIAMKGDPMVNKVLVIALLYVAVIVAIVFITQSQRRIPMQAAKHFRGRRIVSQTRNYLPLKINTAGVMPVIFASSLMIVPALLGQIPGLEGLRMEFSQGRFLYGIFYIGCVFFFAYFWTYLFFQPQEIANNLKEYGSFIPGIRPGENTAQYINYILARITLCGAAFLSVVALFPDVTASLLGMQRFMLAFLGGTGILIVVGVSLDVLQKIESYLLLHHYGGIAGRSRLRGRR